MTSLDVPVPESSAGEALTDYQRFVADALMVYAKAAIDQGVNSAAPVDEKLLFDVIREGKLLYELDSNQAIAAFAEAGEFLDSKKNRRLQFRAAREELKQD